ncbi:hypothetical protein [Chryseobacterium echinoideorum]|uniref:hypothetical protein n=1 Tax=Chryseobacterium echinoideorum TaxID=1549648 RepID=UPI0011869937|nr:hypothetical protein [Chryseobacterium echinoideorum]
MIKKPLHTFHIPVMGLAYTIDSPIRVAQYGISSVVSIIDDEIIEKMKNFYNRKFNLSYQEISNKTEDYRARRITDYLNLMDEVISKKVEIFKDDVSKSRESLQQFMSLIPQYSDLKKGLAEFLNQGDFLSSHIKNFLEENFSPGNIDVNIMTKVDKDNFKNDEQLPVIFNDAHASLRGFAKSTLSSSLVLSAGMNPRLYSYIEEFDDFYPDGNNFIKKKIILKVSDFRSAMIQGNFLAKKGLWVSEYRIESGLNCGGHAFATDGLLLGPILEEFKTKKEELIFSAHSLMIKALEQKGRYLPSVPLDLQVTVQGGVGTADEHQFLLDNYEVNSVGWGSPFLLVPEATCVDQETRNLLAASKEEDYYLSNISPLGVPFNTVKGTSNEVIRRRKESKNKFGSSCPKKLLALSKEYSSKGICTASKKYQDIKISELESQKETLSNPQFVSKKREITEKACLCVGLVNSAYMDNNIEVKGENQGVVICPGPNLAYFDREIRLSEMIQHIYGTENVISDKNRPNVFINELKMYIRHLEKEMADFPEPTVSQKKKWKTFKANILDGITYYKILFQKTSSFKKDREKIMNQLNNFENEFLVLTSSL